MGNFFKEKTCTLQLKEVDVNKRFVAGYLSAFGNVDTYGDMVMPGAFTKTIAERGPSGSNRIKYLWQHDSRKPVGKFTLLKEDSVGLYFEADMSEASAGKDAMTLIKEGILNEHSIGYRSIQERRVETKDYTELQELQLWEGSVVTWGANDQTPFTMVKSATPEEAAKMLVAWNAKHDAIVSMLRKGSLTDETYDQLDIYLKQIQQQYNDLALIAPAAGKAREDADEPHDGVKLFAGLSAAFNNN